MTGQGELIADRYRLEARIGRGAMGVVWRATDERLDRVVAVKQLLADPDELAGDPGARSGDPGDREGRVAARLRHPNAVLVHDSVQQDGRRYLVMEYFPSRSLAALMTAGGPLAAAEVVRIGEQIAAALATAHGIGIVHRDVKPANVLVGSDGTAKIADFGIARALGDGTMSSGAILVGTPAYLAPEVASGEHAGFSSDVFALGSTLYAAVEGGPPFGLHENPIAMLRRVAVGTIPPPRCGGPLAEVLLWMLRRNPGERPIMTEVHQALTAVRHTRPTGTPRPEPPTAQHIPTALPPAVSSTPAKPDLPSTPTEPDLPSTPTEPDPAADPPAGRDLRSAQPPGRSPRSDQSARSASSTDQAGGRGLRSGQPAGSPPRRAARLRRLAGIGAIAAVLVAAGMLIGTLIPSRVVTVVAPGPPASGAPAAPTTTPPTAAPGPLGPDLTTTSATVTNDAPTAATNDVPATTSGCLARYAIAHSWPGGYQAEVTVASAGATITGWTVRFALPTGHAITNLWNGTPTQNGPAVTVTNLNYNGNLAAHATTTFGLTANAPPGPNTLTTTTPLPTCQTP